MNARLLLGLPLLACGCSAPSVWVIPRVAQSEVSGDIASETNAGGGAVVGASTSLDGDLNLDDTNTDFSPRVDVVFGPHVSVGFLSSSFSGANGIVNADFDDGNLTIQQGVGNVATDLDISATNAAFTWDFVPGDVEVGLGLGVTILDFGLRMEQGGTVVEPDDAENIPIPMIAARAGIEKGPVLVSALVSGLSVDSDILGGGDSDENFDVSVFDFDLLAGYKLLQGPKVRGIVVLGFRQFRFDLEGSDSQDAVSFDFDFGGPYLGVNVAL